MNNEEILKLADELFILDIVDEYNLTDNLIAFYRAAFNQGLEAAAKHIESDTHNYALCIRTLKEMK